MRKKLKDISWLSVIALVILILPAFLVVHQPQVHEIVRSKPKEVYYSVIPERAISLQELTRYENLQLTEKAGTIKSHTALTISKILEEGNHSIFQLADGSFIAARTDSVSSDVVLTRKMLSTKVYSSGTVNILYNPFTLYDNQIYTSISGNQTLETLEIATTHWGTYYEVSFDGGLTGWVSSKDVTLEDPKLAQVQQLLTQKYNNSNYSIAVKELDSNFTVGVNQNKELYSASLSKLPILYWVQKRLNAGEISLNDQLKYTAAVNNQNWGAFDPSGTGNLSKTANNQNYSLLDVINRTVKNSDNVGSNMLAYYETNQFSPDFQKEITKIAGKAWNPKTRNASSLMTANVLEALYNEGGASFNALFGTDYDGTRIEAGVPSGIRVAHKVGITDTENHDAAIVFAENPYILVIETTNNTPSSTLTAISQQVYQILQ